ncbi:hypothetical protein J6590_101544, partial [Homalodisca vitripennis]
MWQNLNLSCVKQTILTVVEGNFIPPRTPTLSSDKRVCKRFPSTLSNVLSCSPCYHITRRYPPPPPRVSRSPCCPITKVSSEERAGRCYPPPPPRVSSKERAGRRYPSTSSKGKLLSLLSHHYVSSKERAGRRYPSTSSKRKLLSLLSHHYVSSKERAAALPVVPSLEKHNPPPK